jgi:hypothetical protein
MLIERRSRTRANLHITVFLFPIGASVVIRTQTENIASDAFFCYCDYPFSPGERIKFLLLLPDVRTDSKTGIYLRGNAEIVRVSVGAIPSNFGVACRIDSYSVLPNSDLLRLDQALAAMMEADCA